MLAKITGQIVHNAGNRIYTLDSYSLLVTMQFPRPIIQQAV